MDPMKSVTLEQHTWRVGKQLGRGGFGTVFEAEREGVLAAIKFIPIDDGTERELVLTMPESARNIVSVLDKGTDSGHWIIVMPRAICSLDAELARSGGGPLFETALKILLDISDSLDSLDGSIIHRDIKPANILLIDDTWHLGDFGISRQVDVSTAIHTHRDKGTLPYYSPEQLRGERATSASDMYSFGVVAYELLTGSVPFIGTAEDIKQAHLSDIPAAIHVPDRIHWLVIECLQKLPELRPTAAQFHARLQAALKASDVMGATALERANQSLIHRAAEAEREARDMRSAAELVEARIDFARIKLARISAQMLESIKQQITMASCKEDDGYWLLQFGQASLMFSQMDRHPDMSMFSDNEPFTVLANASIILQQKGGRNPRYPGRSHALWYGDIQQRGEFHWFETAFMQNGGLVPTDRLVPFDASFETDAAINAIRGGGQYLVAWPFTVLDPDEMSESIGRWSNWLAQASSGELEPHLNIQTLRQSWRDD